MLASTAARLGSLSVSLFAFLNIIAPPATLAVPFVNTNAPELQPPPDEYIFDVEKSGAAKRADIVFRNGAICTMAPSRKWCEALAVKNGRIVFVGSNEQSIGWGGANAKVIDLKGRMVLPGFHDTHVHLAEGGVELGQLSLEGVTDIKEIGPRVTEYIRKNPDKQWILGGNWALTLFPNANPRKEVLDEIVSDKPVFLISNDGHSAWANSKAIKLSGVTAKTPDPKLGRIERDPSAGEPSGAFREAACDLIRAKAPKVTKEQMLAGVIDAVKYANSFGITAVTEANAGEDILRAYKKLDTDGTLHLKVTAALETDPHGDDRQVKRAKSLSQKYMGKRIKPVAVKFFADGVVETHTASLLSPYLDKKGEAGISNWSDEKFARLAMLFDKEGFQVHIHAIGDKAVRQALNSIEAMRKENGDLDHRPYIAHLQLIDKADLPRFRQLGVTACFQALWAYRDVFVKDLTVPVLGEERTNSMYPINSLLRKGAVLSAGSDWTVSSLNPLDAIEVAVTRKGIFDKPEENKDEPLNLDERVNLMDFLAAYTCGGAYVDHSDRESGSLEVGKSADLIVLDRNLFEVPECEIHKAKVMQTLIDGEVVYDRERDSAGAGGAKN